MVEKIKAELTAAFNDAECQEVSYSEKGYHLSLAATSASLERIAEFFDARCFYLATIVCVDYIEYLELVYFFSNHQSLCRVKVTLKVDPREPQAPTISKVFDGAAWYEREIHEFYGVFFAGHPNLAYFFLHDGIDTYPLRKERVPVSEADKALLASFRPESSENKFFINLGPQHPSTHGVLRVVLEWTANT